MSHRSREGADGGRSSDGRGRRGGDGGRAKGGRRGGQGASDSRGKAPNGKGRARETSPILSYQPGFYPEYPGSVPYEMYGPDGAAPGVPGSQDALWGAGMNGNMMYYPPG